MILHSPKILMIQQGWPHGQHGEVARTKPAK